MTKKKRGFTRMDFYNQPSVMQPKKFKPPPDPIDTILKKCRRASKSEIPLLDWISAENGEPPIVKLPNNRARGRRRG